tara:strand:+ start:404 stop:628 length:225 start_codon:yes stop_codon:yes gene_type:complete
MEEEVEYLSLYDYLGRAAGPKLGLSVAAEAMEKGVSPKQKVVEHSGYDGKILTYPKQFLVDYFHPTHKDNELYL